MDQLAREVISYLPNVAGAVAIIVVGVALAFVARRFVAYFLSRLGFDRLSDRVGVTAALREATIERNPSEFIGTVILWAVLIFAVVAAVGTLGIPFLAGILSRIVFYALRVVLAIVILILGTAAAGLLASRTQQGLAGAGVRRTSRIRYLVHYSLIYVAAVLAAAVLGVDVSILIAITVIGLGTVALTASLAIGLGLRSLSGNVAASRYIAEGVAEGDRISLNGVSGTVERIGHAVTTVRSPEGRTYLIPNAHFLEHIVEKEQSTPPR